MFGQPSVYYPELIYSELDVYRSHRCTVCTCLQRYGYTISCYLNREVVTISLLLIGQKQERINTKRIRCPYRPWRHKDAIDLPSTEQSFLAACALVLAALRLKTIRRVFRPTVVAERALAPYLKVALKELHLSESFTSQIKQELAPRPSKTEINYTTHKLLISGFETVMRILYAQTGKVTQATDLQIRELRELGGLVGRILNILAGHTADRSCHVKAAVNYRHDETRQSAESILRRIKELVCNLNLYRNHFILYNVLYRSLSYITERCFKECLDETNSVPPTVWRYIKSVMAGQRQVSLYTCEHDDSP